VVVLDTHAWLWWCTNDRRLSAVAGDAIDRADSIGVSSGSALELARLAAAGRLLFDDVDRWVAAALAHDPRIVELPITARVALRAIDLFRRGLTGDPMDQIILASAELSSATLVTIDRRLHEFAPDRTTW
jgi:PIN domain nuclease of toxin-antitoxin system